MTNMRYAGKVKIFQVPVQKCVPVPVKVEGQKCVNVPTQSCETVPVVASVPVPQKQVKTQSKYLFQNIVSVLQETKEGLPNSGHDKAKGGHRAGKRNTELVSRPFPGNREV